MKDKLLEIAKWLAVPVVGFLGWAANEYVQDLVAQEVKPVKSAVEQMVVLQRQQVDAAKRQECMMYKYPDLDDRERLMQCEKESEMRRAYWRWEDCLTAAVEEQRDRDVCGPEPELPE